MKWGTMQEKLANKGDIVETKRWGVCQVLDVEFENDLNWFTYTVYTSFGAKRIQNDQIIIKSDDSAKLKMALRQAIDIIKQWHNADRVFEIYYNNAPEMKPIRDIIPYKNL